MLRGFEGITNPLERRGKATSPYALGEGGAITEEQTLELVEDNERDTSTAVDISRQIIEQGLLNVRPAVWHW